MVVEEEGPPKATKKKVKRSGVSPKVSSPWLVEEPEDEEEDELSDEEDTYDIDDSSPEADSVNVPFIQPIGDEFVGPEKTPSRRHVALPKRTAKSRSRSRLRPFASGYDSPGRFAGSLSHPPIVSPRHVEFKIPSSPSTDSPPPHSEEAQYGARDDIRSPQLLSGKSRIPKDRELDLEAVKTPIPVYGRAGGHSRGSEHHEHRAFAVWGHDESDSNASDSEA